MNKMYKTRMPLIMANSKYSQVHKDKYLDTSTKILSQKMLMCNMEALMFIILLQIKIIFMSNVKVKRFNTNRKILSQGIFMWFMLVTMERSWHKEYPCEIS